MDRNASLPNKQLFQLEYKRWFPLLDKGKPPLALSGGFPAPNRALFSSYPLEAGLEPGIDQALTFTTSAASAAFAGSTTFVLLKADADAHIEFGPAPVATTANWRLEADVAMFFGVPHGLSFKVAAYDGSS